MNQQPATTTPIHESNSNSLTRDVNLSRSIGFLSVLEIDRLGFCGGYLLLNQDGRPEEFHCSLPIQPDRAQQILYGATLKSFLCCEHIGKPLIAKSTTQPRAVFVAEDHLLGLQGLSAAPVVLLWRDAEPPPVDHESGEVSPAIAPAPLKM